MSIEGPGLGANGLNAVVNATLNPATTQDLGNFESKIKTIYGNLLAYLQNPATPPTPVKITIPILGKNEDNFANTASMLYAVRCIQNGMNLHEAKASTNRFDPDMIAVLYYLILGNTSDDVKPTDANKIAAQKWKYLKT